MQYHVLLCQEAAGGPGHRSTQPETFQPLVSPHSPRCQSVSATSQSVLYKLPTVSCYAKDLFQNWAVLQKHSTQPVSHGFCRPDFWSIWGCPTFTILLASAWCNFWCNCICLNVACQNRCCQACRHLKCLRYDSFNRILANRNLANCVYQVHSTILLCRWHQLLRLGCSYQLVACQTSFTILIKSAGSKRA